jgi:hypothetical protein
MKLGYDMYLLGDPTTYDDCFVINLEGSIGTIGKFNPITQMTPAYEGAITVSLSEYTVDTLLAAISNMPFPYTNDEINTSTIALILPEFRNQYGSKRPMKFEVSVNSADPSKVTEISATGITLGLTASV